MKETHYTGGGATIKIPTLTLEHRIYIQHYTNIMYSCCKYT